METLRARCRIHVVVLLGLICVALIYVATVICLPLIYVSTKRYDAVDRIALDLLSLAIPVGVVARFRKESRFAQGHLIAEANVTVVKMGGAATRAFNTSSWLWTAGRATASQTGSGLSELEAQPRLPTSRIGQQ